MNTDRKTGRTDNTSDRGINRRKFIRRAAATAGGLVILSRDKGSAAPSDRIRVATIGVGSMGKGHLEWFSAFPDVDVAAVCDVDQEHLAEAVKRLKERRPRSRVDSYSDFRRVCDRRDIDAITCATPDHWHALVAVEAFRAGKDVYGEKPLSYCAWEGRVMLENLKRYDRVFQLGTQIHATDNYHRVVELVRSGALGEIHTVRLWMTGRSPGMGFPADCTPPDSLDWEMWLGPAPYANYNPARCPGTFRYFLDYSGGVYQDFWCHIADVAFWALEPKGLRRIEARGEPPWNGIADAPEWIEVEFEFEGLKIHWTTNAP
ncbi:MAG TPA: Gfo/Idh/MocA family oxidoreductase, partial [Candidatus Glassbacteria bacterium]|nr:Gfo/Idh/MocA family oxidoreductase [Candidatus Glassbacteria bacterium]